LSTWQSLAGNSVTVEVLHRDGAGAGCKVDIFARPDGEISGRVVEAQAAFHRGGLPGCDTEDGTFTLTQLPPGRYRLTFTPTIGGHLNFQNKYYWPPANNISHAGAMELAFGQHIDDVRFEVSTTDDAH
jgi:hypothetical protein